MEKKKTTIVKNKGEVKKATKKSTTKKGEGKTKKQMHLLLVYPDFLEDGSSKSNGGSYSEGLASISAVVKAGGHKVSLLHMTHKFSEEEFKEKLKSYENVDVVGFSTRTTAFEYVCTCAKWTKEVNENYFVHAGGYHAILVPDSFMKVPYFDAVCIGEGEYPTLELLDKMRDGKKFYDIESFWFNVKGKIIKNPVRPLIEDLDELPFPDIDLFDYKNLEATKVDTALIMLSRGCIYACTYCGNSQFRNVYPNKVKYARFRNPQKSIELIKRVLNEYPNIKFINFRDAIFNMFPKWFDEFIDLYTKEIHLPFTCNLRFDIVTEDTVRRMKEAGCYTIDIGLESGNKEIRQKYLHRYTTDEQMINCSNWFTKYDITVLTYNIIGLPYEDIHKALETVKLNARLKSYQSIPNIFTPYPETILAKIAEDAGYEFELDPKKRVFVKMPQFPEHEILFVADFFRHYVKKYKWCYEKDTKFRHLYEKWLDFTFTGPLTPRKTLVRIHALHDKVKVWAKSFVINHMPKFYLYLRKVKNRIK